MEIVYDLRQALMNLMAQLNDQFYTNVKCLMYEVFSARTLPPHTYPRLSSFLQALTLERTVPSVMTLRLRKNTQAELIASMGRDKGGGAGRRWLPQGGGGSSKMAPTGTSIMSKMRGKSPMLSHRSTPSPVLIATTGGEGRDVPAPSGGGASGGGAAPPASAASSAAGGAGAGGSPGGASS